MCNFAKIGGIDYSFSILITAKNHMIMLTKLRLSLRPASWLLALLIITSVLPAKAQEEPFLFELTEDGSGYIMKPRPYETYEGVLDVPAVRESDGIPIVSVEGFDYQERLLGIQFLEGSQVKKSVLLKGVQE